MTKTTQGLRITREPSRFTLTMARAKARDLGPGISRVGYTVTGRVVVFVRSQTGAFEYPLTHTGHGFTCPCKSFTHRQMCTHYGAVVNALVQMSASERRALLTPDVAKGKALQAHLVRLAKRKQPIAA